VIRCDGLIQTPFQGVNQWSPFSAGCSTDAFSTRREWIGRDRLAQRFSREWAWKSNHERRGTEDEG